MLFDKLLGREKSSAWRLDDWVRYFHQQGIGVQIVRKSVKNINFRIKSNLLYVSVPKWATERHLLNALADKRAWVLDGHQKLSEQKHRQNQQSHLWGEPFDVNLWLDGAKLTIAQRQKLATLDDEQKRYWIYRQQLVTELPAMLQKWQPIVGKQASRLSIRQMKTRWGSCNVRTASINMSLYLAAYPKECTEYVLVHELCHLHHADHSPRFWQTVKKAMPDYEHWHGLLRGKNSTNLL